MLCSEPLQRKHTPKVIKRKLNLAKGGPKFPRGVFLPTDEEKMLTGRPGHVCGVRRKPFGGGGGGAALAQWLGTRLASGGARFDSRCARRGGEGGVFPTKNTNKLQKRT